MIELNSPRGLGDAIYVRAVALHLIARGESVRIYTRWPEVFEGLSVDIAGQDDVAAIERSKGRAPQAGLRNVTACLHCQVPAIKSLDKFELACLQAGIEEQIELRMDWQMRNASLVSEVRQKAAGRPILIYQPLRKTSNVAEEMLQPKPRAFGDFLKRQSDSFRIKVGHPQFTTDDAALPREHDLFGKLKVGDVFDLVSVSDLVFGENCFLPVAAQAMDRSFVLMMARRAMASNLNKVRGVTPVRMTQKPNLGHAIFDE